MITRASIERAVANAVAPLAASVRGIVRRAVLDAFDDAGGIGRGAFAVTDSETDVVDQVEVISQPGVSYMPAKGIEAILLALGASAAHRVAFFLDRHARLKELEAGEVALHIGVAGQVVHLKADGSVVVRGKEIGGGDGGSITLKANGDIVVVPSAAGDVFLGQDGATKKVALADDVDARFAQIRTTFNAHNHPTAPPGPVSPPVALLGALAPTGADNVYGKG